MRTRLTPLACLLVLGCAGFVMLSLTRGQDAKPSPPPPAPAVTPGRQPLTVTPPPRPAPGPAEPIRVNAPADPKRGTDLVKLTPLQRQMYLSARGGADWLYRMGGDVRGHFAPGLLPAVNALPDRDPPLRQAGAAFALARAARYFNNPEYVVPAAHVLLRLLEYTAPDARDPGVRRPVLPEAMANHVALAALVVLAVHELPAPAADLLDQSEQLCNYLRTRQRPDGSLRLGGQTDDPEALDRYAGQALYALMRSQQRRPARWKTDVVRKALPYYLRWWREHKDRDFVPWQTAAYAEAYLLTREKPFADAVFEMSDWLCGLQHERLDPLHPRWLGGFPPCADGRPGAAAPDVGSAGCGLGLAQACRLARELADLQRHERYTAALERCLQFVTGLQYAEGDTQHFADWYRVRLLGGFHASHQDGNLRLDYTQDAVAALVQYLEHVARVK